MSHTLLTMLNGNQIDSITNSDGAIARSLRTAKQPNERLDILFLSIYNRYPQSQEYVKYKKFSRSQQDITILAKGMLNSKNFLFVQ